MRRFAQLLFTGLSALSLLLFVATCVIWVRSYTHADEIAFRRIHHEQYPWMSVTNLFSDGSFLVVGYISDWAMADDADLINTRSRKNGSRDEMLRGIDEIRANYGGQWVIGCFHAAWALPDTSTYSDVKRSFPYRFIAIPFWQMAIVFALPPLLRWRQWARRRKQWMTGKCVSCGYDLRATPDRCPECGLVPEAPKSPRVSARPTTLV